MTKAEKEKQLKRVKKLINRIEHIIAALKAWPTDGPHTMDEDTAFCRRAVKELKRIEQEIAHG